MKITKITAGYVLIAVLAMTGCSRGYDEDRILEELADQDKETIFKRGEELFELEEYEEARRYFSFVYDTFPNDPLGHEAALRVADTYARKKDVVNLTEARLRYKDFVNRYPNDPDRDYALLMMGNTYTARNPRPDRDLEPVHEALDAYRQLVNLYPDSPHLEEAQQQIAKLRGILAEHEWQVASFYVRNKRWRGAVSRLEYLKENYPDYPEMEEVDTLLAQANEGLERRTAELEELRKKRENSTKR